MGESSWVLETTPSRMSFFWLCQVLGPGISALQNAASELTKHAANDASDVPKPEFNLAMLPKSFTRQIIDSDAYRLIFGIDGKGSALGKVLALTKGKGGSIPAEVVKYVQNTVRQVGDTIKNSINNRLAEFELRLRKEFHLVLEAAVATGAPQLSSTMKHLVQVVGDVKNGLADTIQKIEEMRKTANDAAIASIHKVRSVYEQAKEHAQVIQTHLDGFSKLLSEGKSFSSEKEYRVGLMKGWSVVAKILGSVSVGSVPTPHVQTKASIGVSYQATGPEREGSIVEVSLMPSARLQSSVNSLGDEKMHIEFAPALNELVPMMRCMPKIYSCRSLCVCACKYV